MSQGGMHTCLNNGWSLHESTCAAVQDLGTDNVMVKHFFHYGDLSVYIHC